MSPSSPARFCIEPQCPEKASYRGRCQAHARQKEQQRDNAEVRRWYSTSDWQVLREIVLSEQPLCAHCKGTPSAEVDHIVPHRGEHALFWDRSNLQGLCKSCHSAKTAGGQ